MLPGIRNWEIGFGLLDVFVSFAKSDDLGRRPRDLLVCFGQTAATKCGILRAYGAQYA